MDNLMGILDIGIEWVRALQLAFQDTAFAVRFSLSAIRIFTAAVAAYAFWLAASSIKEA